MRRSICYCEPNIAKAGEENTWQFIYTTASTLSKGAKLKFDLLSNGRDIDWQIPDSNLKKTSNVIYGVMGKNKIIPAKEVDVPNRPMPQYEFVLPAELPAGSNFTIIIGAPSAKGKGGNTAQTMAQRRRPFNLYINPTGKGNAYEDPEVFTMDIKGTELKAIRVLSPSFVIKNKRFDIILRFEDEFGNLTNNAPEDTLIELSHEHLRENLKWKLFVPETGFITVPNLYFNEAGIYTIVLYNTKTKETFRSCPIKCFPEGQHILFWGELHGESERFDSTENIESCLRHIRDERALNFYSTSSFESQEETSNEMWRFVSQNISEFDEEDRFTAFLGFQWVGEPGEEGIRQIIFNKDNKQLPRRKDAKSNTLKKIYKSFAPKEIISIPCFTMAKGYEYNFKEFTPEFERVVEIYNSWGSSECLAKEGNLLPIRSSSKQGVKETGEGSIQKALQENCRFGFVAGGLDDRGIYADFFESGQEQYPPGLTAIIAPAHNRQALLEALYNRACYATTGQRIIVGLYLASHPMGSEVSTGTKPGLFVNRHLSGYVAGTTEIATVEIIRNGKVIKVFEPEGYSLEFTFDDLSPIEKIALKGGTGKPPFVYYYLRVTQQDGHMAWSSPIWVDVVQPIKGEGRKVVKKKAAAVPEESLEDFDDFEDEEEEEDEETEE